MGCSGARRNAPKSRRRRSSRRGRFARSVQALSPRGLLVLRRNQAGLTQAQLVTRGPVKAVESGPTLRASFGLQPLTPEGCAACGTAPRLPQHCIAWKWLIPSPYARVGANYVSGTPPGITKDRPFVLLPGEAASSSCRRRVPRPPVNAAESEELGPLWRSTVSVKRQHGGDDITITSGRTTCRTCAPTGHQYADTLDGRRARAGDDRLRRRRPGRTRHRQRLNGDWSEHHAA